MIADTEVIELRYKLLLDSEDYIVITTPEKVLKIVNPAYCELVGVSAASLIGAKFTDSFSEEARKFYSGFITDLTPINPSISTIQLVDVPGDEKWISWKESGIFDEHGALAEIVYVGRNVNNDFERKKGKILSTLTAFKKAIDTNVICTITDARGIITYANERFCAISMYSQDELLGKTHRIVNSQYHSREFFADMWKTISAGEMWTGDIRNKAKDGSYYWVQSVIVPIKDEALRVNGYLSLRILINERKKMEEEKAEHLRSIENMLYMVSHEIRKPITSCQGLIYLLSGETLTEDEYAETIKYLLSSVSELDDYSRKLSDYMYRNIRNAKA